MEKEIREILKTTRKNRGLNQKVLANKVGITQSYYSLIENGEREPSSELFFHLLRELQLEFLLIDRITFPKYNELVKLVVELNEERRFFNLYRERSCTRKHLYEYLNELPSVL